MQDENGNQCEGQFLVPFGSISGANRPLKRTKSLNSPRIPRIDLSPATIPTEITRHESNLPICMRRSPRLTKQSPCGSFDEIPTELIYYILQFLPLTTIGKLGQTSKSMRDILIQWTGTKRMHDRLIHSALNQAYTARDSCGRLCLSRELHTECQRTGVLIKQLTCLFPSSQRLVLYYQLTKEVKVAILQRQPTYNLRIIAATAGVILHAMIAGWDKAECIKVYATLGRWFNIGTLVVDYIRGSITIPGKEHVENTLRMYLRSFFLDFCSPSDRSIWIGIVFDGPEMSSHANIVKLLLLLYAPVDPKENIVWNFTEDDANFSFYTGEFKIIAETLAYLILPSRKSYSPDELVDLIETITTTPVQWPTRSIASLLLLLHCLESKPVTLYFKYLSSSDQTGLAIELLSDTICVAGEFISTEPLATSSISNRSVLNLVRNAMNCGWSHEDRRAIVEEMWSEIREFAVNLLDEAILIGNTEDLHSLMETWKEICVQLTF